MKSKDIFSKVTEATAIPDPMSHFGDIGATSPHRGDPVMSPDLGIGQFGGGGGRGAKIDPTLGKPRIAVKPGQTPAQAVRQAQQVSGPQLGKPTPGTPVVNPNSPTAGRIDPTFGPITSRTSAAPAATAVVQPSLSKQTFKDLNPQQLRATGPSAVAGKVNPAPTRVAPAAAAPKPLSKTATGVGVGAGLGMMAAGAALPALDKNSPTTTSAAPPAAPAAAPSASTAGTGQNKFLPPPAAQSNQSFNQAFAAARAKQEKENPNEPGGGKFTWAGKPGTTFSTQRGDDAAKAAPNASSSAASASTGTIKPTVPFKAYDDTTPASTTPASSNSVDTRPLSVQQNDPLMEPTDRPMPTQIGSTQYFGKSSSEIPSTAVTSGTGEPIKTGSGGYLRSRTPDEIEADSKKPYGMRESALDAIMHLSGLNKQQKEFTESTMNLDMKKMLDLISEASKMTDIKGKKHGGSYGSDYQGDDDEDDTEADKKAKKAKKAEKEPAEKKGRGRPKSATSADKDKYAGASDAFSAVTGSKAPKGKVGKTSVKHSLKDWFDNTASAINEAEAKNKYAIGMAAAEKATSDKPPLKKSTIVKAHEIAKKIKEDEENSFVCVHAKKGKCEVKAKSSYEAAQKAAAKWKLKSTAGIDTHRADKPIHVDESAEDRKENRKWEQIADYEKRAKATKDDIKKDHYMKMAKELRATLKTNDMDEDAGTGLATAALQGADTALRTVGKAIAPAATAARDTILKGADWATAQIPGGKEELARQKAPQDMREGAIKDLFTTLMDKLESGNERGYDIHDAVNSGDEQKFEKIVRRHLNHDIHFDRVPHSMKEQLIDAAREEYFSGNPLDEMMMGPMIGEEIGNEFERNAIVYHRGQAGRVDRQEGDKVFVIKAGNEMDVWPAEEVSHKKQSMLGTLGKDVSGIATGLGRFVSGKPELGESNKFKEESMKDIQIESWDKQLNSMLNESLTISTTQGNDQAEDSVSVTASGPAAQEIMALLRNAGVGGMGGSDKEDKSEQQFSNYGLPMSGDHGDNDSAIIAIDAPDQQQGGDDMLAMMKKMAGLSSDHGSEDYADEEGSEEEVDEGHEEHGDEDEIRSRRRHDREEDEDYAYGQSQQSDMDDEEVDESEAHGDEDEIRSRRRHDKEEDEDYAYGQSQQSDMDDEEVEEGNAFSGAVAKAKADGIQKGEKVKVGGKEYPVKEDEDEGTCEACEMTEAECQCDQEPVEESFANSADDKADQDLDFMINTISGGLNGRKTMHKHGYQNGDNPLAMKENRLGSPMKESTDLLSEFRKLSGLK